MFPGFGDGTCRVKLDARNRCPSADGGWVLSVVNAESSRCLACCIHGATIHDSAGFNSLLDQSQPVVFSRRLARIDASKSAIPAKKCSLAFLSPRVFSPWAAHRALRSGLKEVQHLLKKCHRSLIVEFFTHETLLDTGGNTPNRNGRTRLVRRLHRFSSASCAEKELARAENSCYYIRK